MVSIIVETPSRLHITLIDLHGGVGRVDGGIGVAIKHPKVVLEVKPSKDLNTSALTHPVVKEAAENFYRNFGFPKNVEIKVSESIPEHVGLGSGTQLSLATVSALAKLYGLRASIRELTVLVNRGGTSGIGVAAFENGGFILDGGHSFGFCKQKQSFLPSHYSKAPPPPVLTRYKLPEDWFFVIAIPNIHRSIHGLEEIEVFRAHCPIPDEEVNKLSRIILMKILPSIVEEDIVTLGSALTEIQNIGFKKIEVQLQNPIIKKTMDYIVMKGAYGAGMSSFGPAVYGLTQGENQAKKLALELEDFLKENIGGKVFYTKTNNQGAVIRKIE